MSRASSAACLASAAQRLTACAVSFFEVLARCSASLWYFSVAASSAVAASLLAASTAALDRSSTLRTSSLNALCASSRFVRSSLADSEMRCDVSAASARNVEATRATFASETTAARASTNVAIFRARPAPTDVASVGAPSFASRDSSVLASSKASFADATANSQPSRTFWRTSCVVNRGRPPFSHDDRPPRHRRDTSQAEEGRRPRTSRSSS